MQKHLEKNNEVHFEKIFNQKLGKSLGGPTLINRYIFACRPRNSFNAIRFGQKGGP